jgi:selenocysteine lyase/cysteine desulfurase
VLHVRRELGLGLDVPKLVPAPEALPERLETGTLNHEGIVGAAAAVEFLESLGQGPTRRARLQESFGWRHARGTALRERLWSGLGALPRVRLFGRPPGAARTPTVAFTVDGVTASEVACRLATRGLFVSHGDFYAATVVERLGLGREGLVRAGCACYTSEEEVDRLIEAVRDL